MPQLAIDQLGMLVIALFAMLLFLGAALGIAVSVKSLFFTKTVGEKNSLVTHGDLESKTSAIKADLMAAKNEIMLKIETLAPRESVTVMGTRLLAVEKSHEELREYTHQSVHKLNNNLQLIVNKLVRIETLLTRRVTSSDGDSDDELPKAEP